MIALSLVLSVCVLGVNCVSYSSYGLTTTGSLKNRLEYYQSGYPLVKQFMCGKGHFSDLYGIAWFGLCLTRNYSGIIEASNGAVVNERNAEELCGLASQIAQRFGKYLQRYYCGTVVTTNTPTTVETTTVETTTKYIPQTCAEVFPEVEESCNERCLNHKWLTLGGNCTVFGDGTYIGYTCGCNDVTDCQNYQNKTCQKQCRKRASNGYCRIPERNISCACRFRNKRFNYTHYELPTK